MSDHPPAKLRTLTQLLPEGEERIAVGTDCSRPTAHGSLSPCSVFFSALYRLNADHGHGFNVLRAFVSGIAVEDRVSNRGRTFDGLKNLNSTTDTGRD